MYTLVSLHTTPVEAHIIRGRLLAEGIPAFVLYEHHIWANWSVSNALGSVRLFVPSDRIADAHAVLRSIISGTYEQALIEDQGVSRKACPNCGSTRTGVHAWLWKLTLAVLFTLSIPFPYTSHLYSCDDCKTSWVAHDQRAYPLLVITFLLLLLPFCFYLIYVICNYFSLIAGV